MVSLHILLWWSCWTVRIDYSDFENEDKGDKELGVNGSIEIWVCVCVGWLISNQLFLRSRATKSFFNFQSLKSRSKPLNVISILKCAWGPNFIFFYFFYYLLSHFENRWSNGGLTKQWNRWISDFQSGLINSKKIPKNVKFGLQEHFNIEDHI